MTYASPSARTSLFLLRGGGGGSRRRRKRDLDVVDDDFVDDDFVDDEHDDDEFDDNDEYDDDDVSAVAYGDKDDDDDEAEFRPSGKFMPPDFVGLAGEEEAGEGGELFAAGNVDEEEAVEEWNEEVEDVVPTKGFGGGGVGGVGGGEGEEKGFSLGKKNGGIKFKIPFNLPKNPPAKTAEEEEEDDGDNEKVAEDKEDEEEEARGSGADPWAGEEAEGAVAQQATEESAGVEEEEARGSGADPRAGEGGDDVDDDEGRDEIPDEERGRASPPHSHPRPHHHDAEPHQHDRHDAHGGSDDLGRSKKGKATKTTPLRPPHASPIEDEIFGLHERGKDPADAAAAGGNPIGGKTVGHSKGRAPHATPTHDGKMRDDAENEELAEETIEGNDSDSAVGAGEEDPVADEEEDPADGGDDEDRGDDAKEEGLEGDDAGGASEGDDADEDEEDAADDRAVDPDDRAPPGATTGKNEDGNAEGAAEAPARPIAPLYHDKEGDVIDASAEEEEEEKDEEKALDEGVADGKEEEGQQQGGSNNVERFHDGLAEPEETSFHDVKEHDDAGRPAGGTKGVQSEKKVASNATVCPPFWGEGSVSPDLVLKCRLKTYASNHPLAITSFVTTFAIIVAFVIRRTIKRRRENRTKSDRRGDYAAIAAEYDDMVRDGTFNDDYTDQGDDDGSDDSIGSIISSWSGTGGDGRGIELAALEDDDDLLEEVNG